MPRRAIGSSILAVLAALARSASAEEEPRPEIVAPTPPPPPPPAGSHWYDEVAVHGFVSFSLNANLDNPPPAGDDTFAQSRYRAFDFITNTFSLDVAELTVERAPTSPHDVGVRIVFAAGETVTRIAGALGSSVGPFDLQQAYLYYVMSNGLRLDLGKFVTPAGLEVIENYDGYNDEYSHAFNFLFGPFTHTGIKLSYTMPKLTLAVFAINGWDVLIDNNTDPSFIGQVVFRPTTDVSIGVVYVGGKELPNPDPPWRHYLDVTLTLKAAATVAVAGQFDFGKEGDTSWYAGAAYLTWTPPGDYSLAFRGEIFADPDGVRTGFAGGQTLTGLTACGSYKFGTHHVARLEVRWDHSNEEPFPTHDGTSSSQVTVAANYLGMF